MNHADMMALLATAAMLLETARDVLDDEPGTPGREFADQADAWLAAYRLHVPKNEPPS